MARPARPVPGAMRSVVLIVLLATVPAYADTPRPAPQPEPKAAPAPEPPAPAAPAPSAPAAPAPAPKAAAPATPAPAAPAAKGQPRVLPPASLQDVMPRAPDPSGNASGGPAFGGGTAAGIVIKPPPHPDDRPWPEGMIITPPDVNDPIAIAPGGDGLSPGKPRAPATWTRLFADTIQDGIDAVVELMLPQNNL